MPELENIRVDKQINKKNKIRKEVFYMTGKKIKITEVEGKKYVAVDDYEKLEKDKEVADKEVKASEDYKSKFEAEEKKTKEAESKLAKTAEEKRTAEIKTFVDSHCSDTDMRFLPSQKEILVSLIGAVSNEKTIKFTIDKKEVELSQRDLLEKFISLQPNFSDSIFTELSKGGEEEEGGEEKLTPAEKKIEKYMAENK
ncbi:unnamed protein product, partial [marine sediment metagenome]